MMQHDCYPVSRDQAITNIIDSVAKEQNALASILEAEAEKLKKFICIPCVCPELILDANKSVEKTVTSISLLETQLQLKLRLFDECLCPCPSPCPTQNGCMG